LAGSFLESIDIPLQESLKVYYEGIDILHDKESVMKLSEYDTPTTDDGKFMNFYKLGICLGGFGKKRIPEKKLVTFFAENQNDFTTTLQDIKMYFARLHIAIA
jgi:hypothetical protein